MDLKRLVSEALASRHTLCRKLTANSTIAMLHFRAECALHSAHTESLQYNVAKLVKQIIFEFVECPSCTPDSILGMIIISSIRFFGVHLQAGKITVLNEPDPILTLEISILISGTQMKLV